MRLLLCIALLATSASAFNSQLGKSTLFKNGGALKNRRLAMSPMNAAAMANPLKKLPWNVQKEKEREARRLKLEGAKLYRELGVTEDATFEEIQEATQNLLLRHEGDLKKKVKIEITKDKIMQLRLNQRLGGMLKESKEAKADSYLNEDAVEFKKTKKEFKPPAWTRGLIVKPSEQWRDNCLIFFGGSCVLGVFLPSAAAGLRFMAFLLGAGFMAKRGTPGGEPGQPYRERVGIHTPLAFFFAFVTYVLSAAFAAAFTRAIPGIAENQIRASIENIIVSGSIGLVTAFVQPYKAK